MIVLTAMAKVVDGKGKEFEREFNKLALKVRKDPGVIAYVLHRNVQNPNQYFVFEKYENDEALKYHTATPHFQEFIKNANPISVGPPEVTAYQEIV